MLRRIFRNRDGGVGSSLSGAILPGCASLVVPLLAITALELPAAAIDRMAAPLLGRSGAGASLFAPPAATSANGSSDGASGAYGPYGATDGVVPFDPRFVGSLGFRVLRRARVRDPARSAAGILRPATARRG